MVIDKKEVLRKMVKRAPAHYQGTRSAMQFVIKHYFDQYERKFKGNHILTSAHTIKEPLR